MNNSIFRHPSLMKFAVLGDIHANLEALEAVLADAVAQGVTHHVCIGDVVGYNANPHECVERMRALDCPVVKGNHDEEASADTEIVGLNPLALSALLWTRRNLTDDDKKWLRELQACAPGPRFHHRPFDPRYARELGLRAQ